MNKEMLKSEKLSLAEQLKVRLIAPEELLV